MVVRVIVACLLLTATAPVGFAQVASSEKKAKASEDRICETIVVTGSRLGGRRFCGTRAEWEDKRKQDREAIEKAQVSACLPTKKGKC